MVKDMAVGSPGKIMFKIYFYQDQKGDEPVRQYLDELERESKKQRNTWKIL